MTRTVIVLGTSHKYQKPERQVSSDVLAEFKALVTDICSNNSVKAIAEELHLDTIIQMGLSKSIVECIAEELGICHQYSDPNQKERAVLGIRQENDIRADHIFKGLKGQALEDHVKEKMHEFNSRREEYWWHKLLELDVWPVLFICGANHFDSFCLLLNSNGCTVIEADRDWERP